MIFDVTRVFFVCGPTASGKSALALKLAAERGGEIVNADAYQLYRGLEIISAVPTAEERARIPHHLYGILHPEENSDAGKFARLAAPAIRAIQDRGKLPIITGGSGLYLKFLTHGPAPLPQGNPALRAELDAEPLENLVHRLKEIDPEEASRTALHNRRYVSRALEICILTGGKASDLRDRWERKTAEISAGLQGCVIHLPRAELHARINARARWMMEHGAIEEISRLPASGANAEKAIGVREIRAHLAGEIDLATCEEQIATATRQYAKRQETWFRREKWLAPA